MSNCPTCGQRMPQRKTATARPDDAATSWKVAVKIEDSGRAGTIRRNIAERLREDGSFGGTTAELSRALGVKIQSVTPRMVELQSMGLARKTNDTRVNDGCEREVWVYVNPAPQASLW